MDGKSAGEEWVYAGFWVRVGATLIDALLLMLITGPIMTAYYGVGYWAYEGLVMGWVDFLVSYLLPAVLVIWLWTMLDATPGKMALGVRILDEDNGASPTHAQYVVRYLSYFVSIIPMMLGILWVGFDRRKQGWHDKLAGTVVVRRKGGSADPVQFNGLS